MAVDYARAAQRPTPKRRYYCKRSSNELTAAP